jgi:hypothetical protein
MDERPPTLARWLAWTPEYGQKVIRFSTCGVLDADTWDRWRRLVRNLTSRSAVASAISRRLTF